MSFNIEQRDRDSQEEMHQNRIHLLPYAEPAAVLACACGKRQEHNHAVCPFRHKHDTSHTCNPTACLSAPLQTTRAAGDTQYACCIAAHTVRPIPGRV